MQTQEALFPAAQAALDTKSERFLIGWKKGIQLAGPHLFGGLASSKLDAAKHWHDLHPRLDAIRKALPNRSRTDAGFAAAMASLFNAEEGQKLLNKAGCTLGDLFTILNQEQREALAIMLLNYQGW